MRELEFEIALEDFLYQKFLLEICKTCDDIYFTKRKVVKIPFDEKQRMAEEMLEFVAFALNNLKTSLIKIKNKPKDFEERFLKLAKFLNKKASRDDFINFVLLRYILQGKVQASKIPSSLAKAAFVLLSKGEKEDFKNLEKRVRKIKIFTLRVAALVCPFVELYEKLREEVKKGNIKIKKVLRKKKIDEEALRYIA